MSAPNPLTLLFRLGDPEQRPLLLGFSGLSLSLAGAHVAGPGEWQTALAVAVLAGVPLLALRLSGLATPLFLLVASLGSWLVFQPDLQDDPAGRPVLLLNRLASFAVPPLVLHLILTGSARTRSKLGLVHICAPAVVAGIGVGIHLLLRWGAGLPSSESEIRWAAGLCGACYLGLLVVGLLYRLPPAGEAPQVSPLDRAAELEDEGRFGMAARLYERAGEVEKGAQAAERAGEWARAAGLYRRAGDEFRAGEMYYRAEMLEEALQCYERARAFPAAAALCAQMGQLGGPWPSTSRRATWRPPCEPWRKPDVGRGATSIAGPACSNGPSRSSRTRGTGSAPPRPASTTSRTWGGRPFST